MWCPSQELLQVKFKNCYLREYTSFTTKITLETGTSLDFIVCSSLDLGPKNVLEHSYYAYGMPDCIVWYSLDLGPNVLEHSYHAYSMPNFIVWYSLDLGPNVLDNSYYAYSMSDFLHDSL